MLHLKCEACRLRVPGPAPAGDDDVGDRCPGCGEQLEIVGDLTEIVGFQAIDLPTPAERPSARWLDADGRFSPESVAVALASLGVRPGERP